jgi:16S rRNA (cytosine967-C5)-methyltransferase
VVYSAPKDFVNLLIYHYGTENTENFLKAALEPKKITIRVNTIKTTTDELINMLINDGVGVEKTDVNNALYITLNDAVYELDAFKKGLFHVEDISSQYCIEALAPYPGCTMIDVCSAPGGKSFTTA